MRLHATCLALFLSAGLGGCSMHALTGDMLNDFTVQHMTPYLMSTDDVGIGCETGVSLVSMVLAYDRVTKPANKAAVGSLATAASCAQEVAWENELRQIRAVKAGNASEAKDARIAEKRAHGQAAARFYRAYQRTVAHYGEPGGECPKLEHESDEITYLLGLTSGIQAVQHDRAAGEVVGVPLDVPRKSERGLTCLNNEKWWGVPMALRAAVWTGVPGATPEGEDPWARLDEASALAVKSNVRMSLAVQAWTANAAGKNDVVRKVIIAHAKSVEAGPAPKKYRMLDAVAQFQMRVLSDKLWTQATGHRTPNGQLGTFWDDTADDEEGGDALLEGADDGPAPAAPPAQPKGSQR